MKFYSDLTNTLYDTVEALDKAEKELKAAQQKKEELKLKREERAKEVEEAVAHANELMNQFLEDYGSFHFTIKDGNGDSLRKLAKLFW